MNWPLRVLCWRFGDIASDPQPASGSGCITEWYLMERKREGGKEGGEVLIEGCRDG